MSVCPVTAQVRKPVLVDGDDAEMVLLSCWMSGDPQQVLDVLAEHGARLLSGSRLDVLRTTLDDLPDAVRRAHPVALVLRSMLARLDVDVDAAVQLSIDADEVLSEVPAGRRGQQTLDQLAGMRLWRSRLGWADPEAAITSARDRLGCDHTSGRAGAGRRHTLRPGQTVPQASWLMVELASTQVVTGELAECAQHLHEVIYNGGALRDDSMIAAGLAYRGFVEVTEGAFQTAGNTAAASLSAAGANSPYVGWAHLVLSWSHLHALDLEAAQHHLHLAQVASLELDPLLRHLIVLQRAKLLTEEGAVADAQRLLVEVGASEVLAPPFARRLEAVTRAQVATIAGDVREVREQVACLERAGFPEEGTLFSAIADAGAGRAGDALARVDDLATSAALPPPVATGAAALRIGLLLLEGQRERAATLLPDLLTAAAPQRMFLLLSAGFVGGRGFDELVSAEARRHGGHPFAAEALAALRRYTEARGAGDGARPPSGLGRRPDQELSPTRLTERERQVLTELSYGGVYADVAAALFVSENTIKTHLTSVYRKLGVERRVDALRVARERRLI